MSSPLSDHRSLVVPAIVGAVGASALVGALAYNRQPPTQAATAPRKVKPVSGSSVSYRCKISPEYCDEHGRVYGGELLKLIDVSAGIVAAKHAGGPCLTISADRVIFLQEIKVGDVVQLSAAVNRAWGSSMEIGVRVMREQPHSPLGHQTYCCHAYLTFVAKHVPPPTPSLLSSLSYTLYLRTPPKPVRFQVPELAPKSTLETKRFLLAGRRRAHRIQRAKKSDALLATFREEIFRLEAEINAEAAAQGGDESEDNIAALQQEMIVEAYMRQDPDVHVEGEFVVASIEGFMEPVKVPLADVKKASATRGHGGYRKLSLPSNEDVEKAAGRRLASTEGRVGVANSEAPLAMKDTLVVGLWIVRPQHANSKQVLFGGTLMRWIEEMSSIAARRVLPSCSWSSAAIDSLTFKSAVLPGEVCYVRACVVRVWDSSVEVFALAMAEDRNSPNPTVRLVSESFFTLVAIDPVSGRPLKGALRHVQVPDGPAREIADGAAKRREERLQDKRILQRVYA
ncbi:HotDog domain-containing protein [Leucosporidium creatinivorum]|uniref:HotDog domain-containing protein n=1 Tax=Leucosporidium creatinivorum TaxID=106004 RepID=A0A1Y2G6D8_9BASI|nr:HotDog domain-containing protein [Leucosporidium creatinivorum]